MPNHVSNKIRFFGDQKNIVSVLNAIKGNESFIDFNSLVPMPQSLNIESGSVMDSAIIAYITNKLTKPLNNNDIHLKLVSNMFNKDWAIDVYNRLQDDKDANLDELYQKGKIYCDNYDKYGCTDWYSWCCHYWGTKWNAYGQDSDRNRNEIYFNTAWSMPEPIYHKLAELCGKYNVEFNGAWCDEDWASGNCGGFECHDGEFYIEYCDTEEDMKMACESLWGYNPDDEEY